MENTNLNQSRLELKYIINYFQYISIEKSLGKVLKEDKHNEIGGYMIRSLYFDDYSNSDFYNKLSGIENRKKIRLRVYDYNSPKAKLEIKRKHGEKQEKKAVIINKEDAKQLIKCNYEVLKKYNSKTADTIYNIMKINRMKPVVLIEYKRKAFIHPINNIRITLDKEIRSNEYDFDIFDENLVLTPTEEYNTNILEIKYNDFIFKWITDLFKPYNLERQSYSKYIISRGIFEKYMA